MLYPQIAQTLVQMQKADLTLREQLIQENKLFEGYNETMEALHNQNADQMAAIMEQIGYPTPEKVGKEAAEAAWLIVQHAISNPLFMKNCAQALQKEVQNGKAEAKHWAYLTDRIAVLGDKKQLYGTQFDWDEHGELSPLPIKYKKTVNKRRVSMGFNTLEEQIILMRKRAELEQETPPSDFEERKQAAREWQKRVGWIQ